MSSPALPHSDEAERAVLGGVMLDNAQGPGVFATLGSDDFYSDRARRCFRAMATLAAGESRLDLVTVVEELRRTHPDDADGDLKWLATIVDGTARSGNVGYYARIVMEKSARRAIMREAARIAHVAGNGSTSEDLAQALEDAKRIFDDAVAGVAGEDPKHELIVPATLKGIGNPDVLQVPWLIEGLIPAAGLTEVAAHYKTGKTFLMYRLLIDALFGSLALGSFPMPRNLKVMLWQFEMPEDVNLRRFHKLCRGAGIDPEQLYQAEVDGRFQQFVQPDLSLNDKRDLAIFHRKIDKFGPDLLLVDSLSEAFPDADANSGPAVRQMLRNAFRPVTVDGRGSVGLHHKRKTFQGGKPDDAKGSILGSQAFGAAARTIYTLDRAKDEQPEVRGRFVVELACQGSWDLETKSSIFVVQDNADGTATTVEPFRSSTSKTGPKAVTAAEEAAVAFADLARNRFKVGRQEAIEAIRKDLGCGNTTATDGLKLAREKGWVATVKDADGSDNVKVLVAGPNTDWEDLA